MLPNLPSELDIVVLLPPDHAENETWYWHQFQLDFRVWKSHIITWLRFLKANHSGYRDITISLDRIQSLPADDDVSSSFVTIINGTPEEPPPEPDDSSSSSSNVSPSPLPDDHPSIPDDPSITDDSPPNTQSMVPNLNVTATEVNLIMQQLTGREAPPGIPVPSIWQMPVDEASGKDHIFALAFPTLYPTGQADFNMSWVRKVALNDYAQHLLCYQDGRFGRYPRWRFFIFNIIIRRKANAATQFYVFKTSGLKDLDQEELANALLADESLLPQIVRQSSNLTRTRPF
jgi:hypothetical protein